jgi:hypothetical protein
LERRNEWQRSHSINTIVVRTITEETQVDNMPRSRVRGGRKAHNKRIKARNARRLADIIAIEALKKKIWEEAKERHEQEKLDNNL